MALDVTKYGISGTSKDLSRLDPNDASSLSALAGGRESPEQGRTLSRLAANNAPSLSDLTGG